MSKKQKVIFGSSLVVNALLIILLIVGYLKMDLVHEELFRSEVQYKLVELDGLIEYQKETNWAEPNLVTTQLSGVLNGIFVATNSGKYASWLSKEQIQTMEQLYAVLSRYPHDELYKFSELTEEDKEHFEELQLMLQEVGFGMEMTMDNDWNVFSKSESLLNLLLEQNS